MSVALSIQGVRKSFGRQPVLKGLDLEVEPGSLTVVLGPSGCGKTTLLRLVAGFERADAGSIRLGDALVSGERAHVPPEKRRVGVVSQEGALFPHLDVAANVGFGVPRSQRQSSRIDELLSLVGLSGLERRFPHELSGGEQQRVALARALGPAPDVMLLDEPFSALDPTLRTSLRVEVRDILRMAGITALLVTHDQTEALSLADQVAVMRAGRLVQTDAPASVYCRPIDADVARFLGAAVLLPGDLVDGHICCALGNLPVYDRAPANGPATAMIRPEQLVLSSDEHGLAARVVGVDYHGHDALVRLVGDSRAHVELMARVLAHSIPAVGDRVTVCVRGQVVAFAGTPDGDTLAPTNIGSH